MKIRGTKKKEAEHYLTEHYLTWKELVWTVGIVLFLEIFVFNFRFWESLTFRDRIEIKDPVLSGIEVSEGGGEGEIWTITDDTASIRLNDLDVHVSNLLFDAEVVSSDGKTYPNQSIRFQPFFTDDANSLLKNTAGTAQVINGIPVSRYVRIHTSGKSTSICLTFTGCSGKTLRVKGMALNAVRPMMVNAVRMGLLVLLGLLILLFRPGSELYREGLDLKKRRQKTLLLSCACLQAACLLFVGVAIRPWKTYDKNSKGWPANAQYEYMADSLADGRVDIEVEVPGWLKEMDNPYDWPARAAEQAKHPGKAALFDFAYYDGKYYMYFGIVPELLFSLPYRLIFHTNLQSWIPVVLCIILYSFIVYALIFEISRRFKHVSIGLYLLSCAVFTAGSSVEYLVYFGNVYTLPIACGLMFAALGLTLWMRSADRVLYPAAGGKTGGSVRSGAKVLSGAAGRSGVPDQSGKAGPSISARQGVRVGRISLLLGSLCMALVAGCRPQLLIAFLFAVPIFLPALKKEECSGKERAVNGLYFLIPFAVIGGLLMYYNDIRFDSPFNFGAAYNLTSNDMTHKGFVLDRNFLGIFAYLFLPARMKTVFPFFATVDVSSMTEYMGTLINEPMLGGWFALNAVGVFALTPLLRKKCFRDRGLRRWAVLSSVLALIVMEADLQMSAITWRYQSDFGWLFSFTVVLSLFAIGEYCREENRNMGDILLAVTVTAAFSLFMNYFSTFADGRYGMLSEANPFLYYYVKYLFFAA